MTDDLHEEIIAKAFPTDYEPWRVKLFKDLTAKELSQAIADNQNIMRAAEQNYNDEEADYDDRRYAYESMVRARHRLADLRRAYDSSAFDVV